MARKGWRELGLSREAEGDLQVDPVSLLDSSNLDAVSAGIEELHADDLALGIKVDVQVWPNLLGSVDGCLRFICEKHVQRFGLLVVRVHGHVAHSTQRVTMTPRASSTTTVKPVVPSVTR